MITNKMLLRQSQMASLIIATLLSASCASLHLGTQKEPSVIVFRNRSGADIVAVKLREAGSGPQMSRFGSISPVPNGVSQEVGRPTDPPALPRTVAIEWVDIEGRTIVRELSLSKALKDARGGRGEALVFEIGPFEDVLVFVEERKQGR